MKRQFSDRGRRPQPRRGLEIPQPTTITKKPVLLASFQKPFSTKLWEVLACPDCGASLQQTGGGALCPSCRIEYSYSPSGALDLHLRNKKKYLLEFTLPTPNTPLPPPEDVDFKPLLEKLDAEVDFSGIDIPVHLTKELLSYFPKAASGASLMLDLGCGNAIHRQVCEHAGFEYVGLDYHAPGAPISGDAHALPFKNDSFDFILSIAVFEHIRFPFVMIREAYRVLKPGGKFIGTVAFLEPFHGDSFYHHTHLGVVNTLQYGGFTIERIAPSEKWSVFAAQAHMARLFPRAPRRLSGFIVRLPHLLSKLWWRMGSLVYPKSRAGRFDCIRDTTGAFAFMAGKEIKAK